MQVYAFEPSSRKALDYFSDAVSMIERFKQNGRRETILEGKAMLERACEEDPGWVTPAYYCGILADLAGRPQEAIDQYNRIEHFFQPPFLYELLYNQGVALFHRYHKVFRDQAKEKLKKVWRDTDGPIKLLAGSFLAQVLGMDVLGKVRSEESRETARAAYSKCEKMADATLARLENWLKGQTDGSGSIRYVANEIKWGALNAKGFARNFYSDYLPAKDREGLVQEAVKYFNVCLQLKPNHWASLCNLASAYMRMGATFSADNKTEEAHESLEKALATIDRVLADDIRPNYCFALYERGRILRIIGDRDEALKSFNRAISQPEGEKDVSDPSINSEIDRTKNGDRSFP